MILFSHLKKLDKPLILAAVFLAFLGILELTGMAQNDSVFLAHQNKQIIALAAGIFIMFGVSLFDYRFFKNNSYGAILFYAGIIILLAVLLVAGEQTRGTVAWFKIAGFAFAPVEITKIALVVLLAKYFSGRQAEMYRFFHLIVSFAYVALPAALVLLQPDLGSALVLLSLWLGLVLFSGISRKQIIIMALCGVLVFTFAWAGFLKDYQKERILNVLNPYHDPQGIGYNVIQSMIAIGDGGLSGKGLGYGSQVQLKFLPEAHTDFMLASIAEELGFISVLAVFSLVLIIIWRIIKVAFIAENNFARMFCGGMALLIFIQTVINSGMNFGISPVIGITFPFLSYGGSSLIALFFGLGLVQSIKVRS